MQQKRKNNLISNKCKNHASLGYLQPQELMWYKGEIVQEFVDFCQLFIKPSL